MSSSSTISASVPSLSSWNRSQFSSSSFALTPPPPSPFPSFLSLPSLPPPPPRLNSHLNFSHVIQLYDLSKRALALQMKPLHFILFLLCINPPPPPPPFPSSLSPPSPPFLCFNPHLNFRHVIRLNDLSKRALVLQLKPLPALSSSSLALTLHPPPPPLCLNSHLNFRHVIQIYDLSKRALVLQLKPLPALSSSSLALTLSPPPPSHFVSTLTLTSGMSSRSTISASVPSFCSWNLSPLSPLPLLR